MSSPDELCSDFVASWMKLHFDAHPTDRSCYSCDYEMAGCCANNQHMEIPLPFRSKGCDQWKDEGAPF